MRFKGLRLYIKFVFQFLSLWRLVLYNYAEFWLYILLIWKSSILSLEITQLNIDQLYNTYIIDINSFFIIFYSD